MKQPTLGIVATAAVIVVSWVTVWALGLDLFMGWASYAIMGAIPFAIVVGAFWQGGEPRAVAGLSQPVRGLVYLALAVVAAALVSVVHFAWRGGGQQTPPPFAVMVIITSVVTTFFLAIAMGGWPFVLIRNKLLGGVLLLVAAYSLNAVLTTLLLDFGFAQGAPFYEAGLDPGGAFNAWAVVAVFVTALAVMFLFLTVEVWPLTAVPGLRTQPLLGIVWTAVCFVAGWAIVEAGTAITGWASATFMAQVSIPFLFGAIIVLQMLGGTAFARVAQPWRGLLRALTSALVGVALALVYSALMPVLSGETLPGGETGGFAAELWLANSLLAVTFPLLAFYGDFFQLWPLAGRARREPVAAAAD